MTRRNVADDEMYDGDDDLRRPDRLGEFLAACRESLLRAYADADREALRYQARYRRLILFASLFTTAALLFAAWTRVSRAPTPEWFGWTEATLALGSAVLVGIGLGGQWQKKWLLLRYRAERYRLLKFHLLIDTSTWVAGSEGWRSALASGIREVTELEHEDLEDEAAAEPVAPLCDSAACAAVRREETSALLDYYKRRRLALQIAYFKTSARKGRSIWLDALWVPGVFFVAMAAVLVRFVLERTGAIARGGWENNALAVAPILLPALLGALRLRVTANEVSRNRSRSLARESALREIARRVGGIDESLVLRVTGTVREMREPAGLRLATVVEGSPDAAFVFSNLALAEQILSTDQHEWLRLMLEAEWYR